MRKFTEIVTDLVAELVMLLLRHNYRLREKQTLSIVFASATYQRLIDERSMLYLQHPDYLFSLLMQELAHTR